MKKDDTNANLEKPKDMPKKIKGAHGYELSLHGNNLQLNTYTFSTIWINAWVLNTKDEHFKDFVKDVEVYLQPLKLERVLENVSKRIINGGLTLINF